MTDQLLSFLLKYGVVALVPVLARLRDRDPSAGFAPASRGGGIYDRWAADPPPFADRRDRRDDRGQRHWLLDRACAAARRR